MKIRPACKNERKTKFIFILSVNYKQLTIKSFYFEAEKIKKTKLKFGTLNSSSTSK
jgi:hypothetical protein